MTVVLPDAFLDSIADAIAERVAPRVLELVADRDTPWMNKAEAIEYSRMPKGTFEKLVAAGDIPHHGGRTQLFHRRELDRALGYTDAAAHGGQPIPIRRQHAA